MEFCNVTNPECMAGDIQHFSIRFVFIYPWCCDFIKSKYHYLTFKWRDEMLWNIFFPLTHKLQKQLILLWVTSVSDYYCSYEQLEFKNLETSLESPEVQRILSYLSYQAVRNQVWAINLDWENCREKPLEYNSSWLKNHYE